MVMLFAGVFYFWRCLVRFPPYEFISILYNITIKIIDMYNSAKVQIKDIGASAWHVLIVAD
jgi:hypothetical protein